MSNEWFERGEFPPVGTECETLSQIGWVECVILAHGNCKNSGRLAFWQADHDCGGTYTIKRFRPIRTEREKAIEAALSVMSTKTISNTQRKTINKLYDAGLLRLPEDKK